MPEVKKTGGESAYKDIESLRSSMEKTGLAKFGTETRDVSIFGEGGLKAGATKKDFVALMKDVGFDKDMAKAAWDAININSDGDSKNTIDADELEQLMQMYGDDTEDGRDEGFDKITIGSFWHHLGNERKDKTEEVSSADGVNGSSGVNGINGSSGSNKAGASGKTPLDYAEQFVGMNGDQWNASAHPATYNPGVWCADFVANVLTSTRDDLPSWYQNLGNKSHCFTILDAARNAGAAANKDASKVGPGDVIIFQGAGGAGHIGIIEKIENGIVYTVEGNTGGGVVAKNQYPVGSGEIVDFVKMS